MADSVASDGGVPTLARKLAAEFLGTFCLVLVGTGAIVVNDVSGGGVTPVGIALCFGLVVLAMILTLNDVSGSHINPAVTCGLWAARLFPAGEVIPYVVSQCAGALAASGLLRLLFPDHPTLGATLPSGSEQQAFVFEMILTGILMFTILNVAARPLVRLATVATAVGAVITLAALWGGPVCGASLNPARSLGPAVLSATYTSLWLYLVAPVCGALTGVVAWRAVRG
jgi:aquaporin Z